MKKAPELKIHQSLEFTDQHDRIPKKAPFRRSGLNEVRYSELMLLDKLTHN
jgi:hypothetical protein